MCNTPRKRFPVLRNRVEVFHREPSLKRLRLLKTCTTIHSSDSTGKTNYARTCALCATRTSFYCHVCRVFLCPKEHHAIWHHAADLEAARRIVKENDGDTTVEQEVVGVAARLDAAIDEAAARRERIDNARRRVEAARVGRVERRRLLEEEGRQGQQQLDERSHSSSSSSDDDEQIVEAQVVRNYSGTSSSSDDSSFQSRDGFPHTDVELVVNGDDNYSLCNESVDSSDDDDSTEEELPRRYDTRSTKR